MPAVANFPALRLLLWIAGGILTANLLTLAAAATGLQLARATLTALHLLFNIGFLFVWIYLFSVGPLQRRIAELARASSQLKQRNTELESQLDQSGTQLREWQLRLEEVASKHHEADAHAREQLRKLGETSTAQQAELRRRILQLESEIATLRAEAEAARVARPAGATPVRPDRLVPAPEARTSSIKAPPELAPQASAAAAPASSDFKVVPHPAPAVGTRTVPQPTGELILLADQNAAAREVTRIVLLRHGYTVLEASDGVEALGLIAQHVGKVRLILANISLPGMDGPSLARAARDIDPAIRMIAATGRGKTIAQEEKLSALQTLGIHQLLAKPYTAQELLQAVERELSQSAGSKALSTV